MHVPCALGASARVLKLEDLMCAQALEGQRRYAEHVPGYRLPVRCSSANTNLMPFVGQRVSLCRSMRGSAPSCPSPALPSLGSPGRKGGVQALGLGHPVSITRALCARMDTRIQHVPTLQPCCSAGNQRAVCTICTARVPSINTASSKAGVVGSLLTRLSTL